MTSSKNKKQLSKAHGTKRVNRSGRSGNSTAAEENEIVNDLVCLRDKESVTVMAPVCSTFLAIGKSLASKTIGIARIKGEARPLIHTFSGWDDCVEDNNELLDSHTWTQHALRIADHYEQPFPRDVYEKPDVPPGTNFASHAEIKLMLWVVDKFVTDFLGVGEQRSIKKRLSKMPGLKNKITPEVEIIVSHPKGPCASCKKFRALIYEEVNIWFEFKICLNAGRLIPVNNVNSNMVLETDTSFKPQVLIEKPREMPLAKSPVLRLGKEAAKKKAKLQEVRGAEVKTVTTVSRVTQSRDSSIFDTPKKRRHDFDNDEDYVPRRPGSPSNAAKRKSPRVVPVRKSFYFDNWNNMDVSGEDLEQSRRLGVSSFGKKMETFKHNRT